METSKFDEKFEPYIRHIRFPHFKNLEDGLCIDFSQPITAIVGPNGTNKTSILRALEGCTDYVNFGNYWFSTPLDAILSKDRHRFIHGYKVPSGKIVEAIKTRIASDNPDYFEPSRPLVGDGMEAMPKLSSSDESDLPFRVKTRWKAIAKEVVFIDFRHEIPAYDLFFHLNIAGRANGIASKKALVRRRASHVSSVLARSPKSYIYHKLNRVISPTEDLSDEVINWVCKILGRKYSSIKVVKHSFYLFEGYTIRLQVDGRAYSEAFAGSGEYAAVMMVKKVCAASNRSLIILDEPEVSLYPAAQRALMKFLSVQSMKKGLQVVVSTHSSEIIRDLPASAIKVLVRNDMTGLVSLFAQSTLPNEAFRQIGAPSNKHVVYVEDDLAAEILKRAIRDLGPGYANAVDFVPLGGAELIMNKHVPSIVRTKGAGLVILDGDRKPKRDLKSVELVSDGELWEELSLIKVSKKNLGLDGGAGPSLDQGLTRAREIISWAADGLRYLPGNTPEQLILKMENRGAVPEKASDAKKIWVERAGELFYGVGRSDLVSSFDVLSVQRMVLSALDDDNEDLAIIRDTVTEFLERA